MPLSPIQMNAIKPPSPVVSVHGIDPLFGAVQTVLAHLDFVFYCRDVHQVG